MMPLNRLNVTRENVEQVSKYKSTCAPLYVLLDTGWQRCIGCLKLHVSFRKRATAYGFFGGK